MARLALVALALVGLSAVASAQLVPCNITIIDPTDPSVNNVVIKYYETTSTNNDPSGDYNAGAFLRDPIFPDGNVAGFWNFIVYDDSQWKDGRFPFGENIFCPTIQSYYPAYTPILQSGIPVLPVPSQLGTQWTRGSDLYIRIRFTLPPQNQLVSFFPILELVKDNDLLHLSYNNVNLVDETTNTHIYDRGSCGAVPGAGVSAKFNFPLDPTKLLYGGAENLIAIKVRDRDREEGTGDQSFVGLRVYNRGVPNDGTDFSITIPGSCVCMAPPGGFPVSAECNDGGTGCCSDGTYNFPCAV